MCNTVKAFSQNSSHFPCIAAGYCDDYERDADWDVQCELAPVLRCVPSRLCTRRRHGLRFSCALKPGIGRWIGMQQTFSEHAGALAAAVWHQPRCGEAGASKYCIAKPRGMGAVAEAAGRILSLGYGTMRTVSALETPGGDDDREWLTFWLVVALFGVIESFAAVVLTAVPRYYEAKLLFLVWLMFGSGSEMIYRRFRRSLLRLAGPLLRRLGYDRAGTMVRRELAALPPRIVSAALAWGRANEEAAMRAAAAADPNAVLIEGQPSPVSRQSSTDEHGTTEWSLSAPLVTAAALAEDEARGLLRQRRPSTKDGLAMGLTASSASLASLSSSTVSSVSSAVSAAAAAASGTPRVPSVHSRDESFTESCVNTPDEELLRLTYAYIETVEGRATLDTIAMPAAERSALMQRSAEDASFQPRFVHVFLVGTIDGASGELPPMDTRGRADTYCVCRLEDADGARYPMRGVRSSVAYGTTTPRWEESLELMLRGGTMGGDGIFRNAAAGDTKLRVEIFCDYLGLWGALFSVSRLLGCALAAGLVVAYAVGLIDHWSEEHFVQVYAAFAVVALMLLPSAVAHSLLDADDLLVGASASVPLEVLMDQRTYGLDVWLRDADERPHGKRNARGGLGGVRISIALSER